AGGAGLLQVAAGQHGRGQPSGRSRPRLAGRDGTAEVVGRLPTLRRRTVTGPTHQGGGLHLPVSNDCVPRGGGIPSVQSTSESPRLSGATGGEHGGGSNGRVR